jgi:hypothetical protein
MIKEDPMNVTFRRIGKFSSGWLARYEIWSLEEHPSRQMDVSMPISIKAVKEQLKTALPLQKGWNVSFPTAISPTLRSFVVLDQVHYLKHGSTSNWSSGAVEHLTFSLLSSLYISFDSHARVQAKFWTIYSPDGNTIFCIEHYERKNYITIYSANPQSQSFGSIMSRANGKRLCGVEEGRDMIWPKAAWHPLGPALAFKCKDIAILCIYFHGMITLLAIISSIRGLF